MTPRYPQGSDLRTYLMFAACLAALVVAAFIGSGRAAADPAQDAMFFQALSDAGIGYDGNESELVTLGYAICVDRGNGYSEDEVAAAHSQLAPVFALLVVRAAENAYCPGWLTIDPVRVAI